MCKQRSLLNSSGIPCASIVSTSTSIKASLTFCISNLRLDFIDDEVDTIDAQGIPDDFNIERGLILSAWKNIGQHDLFLTFKQRFEQIVVGLLLIRSC